MRACTCGRQAGRQGMQTKAAALFPTPPTAPTRQWLPGKRASQHLCDVLRGQAARSDQRC